MKPMHCPFCGGSEVSAEHVMLRIFRVRCNGCGAEGPTFDGRKKHRGSWASDAAVAAWNQREAAERAADKGA